MRNPQKTDYDRYWLPVAGLALIVGIFVRFWDLGGAPLAVDEYYFGTSILNILERGLPEFACGGIYPRSLLLQYMTVPLLHLGLDLEFAIRFWPAIASAVTILGAWRIANLAGGRMVGSIAVILTSLSLWEIEFGRFGRMYAPFQAVVVWYVYFQIQHLVLGKERARWAYLGLSAISIFVYSGTVFLLIFNFLPLIWREKKWTIGHLAVAAGLLLFGSKFHTTSFRLMSVPADQLPPQAGPTRAFSAPFDLPPLPDLLLPILICGLVVFALGIIRFRQQLFFRHPAAIFWTIAAILLSFGLIGFGLALVLAGLIFKLPSPPTKDTPRLWTTCLSLLVSVWLIVLSTSFLTGGSDAPDILKNTVKYMFNYPNVYGQVLRPWLEAIPVTTTAMIVLTMPVLWKVFRTSDGRHTDGIFVLRYLLGAVILWLLLAAFFWQPSESTRYTHFLYPLILILASAGMVVITSAFPLRYHWRTLVPLTLVGALLLLAEDFYIRHMLSINEPEYRYRTAYEFQRARHYYLRWDFRAAAEYVNARLDVRDRVIAFDQPLPHYLDRTDGAFVREGTSMHEEAWACNGTRHVWSNAPLLDRELEVHQMIEEADGRVWMIMRTPAARFVDPFEPSLVQQYGLQPEFVTRDGNLAVYRIEPNRRGT